MAIKRMENGRSIRVELKTGYKITLRDENREWAVANTIALANTSATTPVTLRT